MLIHNTHYATFKVKCSISFDDVSFPLQVPCFSHLFKVPRLPVEVSYTSWSSASVRFSSKSRLLEDIRFIFADRLLCSISSASSFNFYDEKINYSHRAKDFLSGFMFEGSYSVSFDFVKDFFSGSKLVSSIDRTATAVCSFAVYHVKG